MPILTSWLAERCDGQISGSAAFADHYVTYPDLLPEQREQRKPLYAEEHKCEHSQIG